MKYLLGLVCLAAATFTQAQTKEGALQVVDQLFEAMHTRNTTLASSLFHESATMMSTHKDKSGEYVLTNDSVANFIMQIGSIPASMKIEERIHDKIIQLDENLAQVYTPYTFLVNDNISHCGANTFLMVFLDDRWQILNITDTRRKNCE